MIAGILHHDALPFIGEPGVLANAMLFLASEESRRLTGQLMVVDGGLTSHSTIAEIRRPPE